MELLASLKQPTNLKPSFAFPVQAIDIIHFPWMAMDLIAWWCLFPFRMGLVSTLGLLFAT